MSIASWVVRARIFVHPFWLLARTEHSTIVTRTHDNEISLWLLDNLVMISRDNFTSWSFRFISSQGWLWFLSVIHFIKNLFNLNFWSELKERGLPTCVFYQFCINLRLLTLLIIAEFMKYFDWFSSERWHFRNDRFLSWFHVKKVDRFGWNGLTSKI